MFNSKLIQNIKHDQYILELILIEFFPSNGLPLWFSLYRIRLQCRKPGFDPWVGKIPWRRKSTHSSILAWRIPVDRKAWWATVHGLQTVGRNLVTAPLPSSNMKVHIFMTDSYWYMIWLQTHEIHCMSWLKLLSHTRHYHLFGLRILAPS